ncbi:hypothetical protein PHMEG_00040541 [Phytophthora megakarya]|uniref:Uncharacterized protein n=1 Tax=Phytophthora megakarya TaxID=4795 RepID=A0A225UD60_9STRA|nr:hypothetical protein PHMEG_00040541 [Phytophthora megakarya]
MDENSRLPSTYSYSSYAPDPVFGFGNCAFRLLYESSAPLAEDSTDFDQEGSLSERVPPDLRYRGYWRNFRGAGHKKDTELGFSQWERDNRIPPRAVELFITMAFKTLRLNMPTLDRLEVLEIKAMLDAVDDAWRDYNLDRVKRNDRLRTKYLYICWKWSLESPPPVDGRIPEFLFEPSMPLYGMKYLTWIP